jgi:hypothetical protein
MTTRRIAIAPVEAGSDLDKAEYEYDYRCDGCNKKSESGELMRMQGQAYRGTQQGFISADLCAECVDTKPVCVIVQGI